VNDLEHPLRVSGIDLAIRVGDLLMFRCGHEPHLGVQAEVPGRLEGPEKEKARLLEHGVVLQWISRRR